jgi:hypothetical protein
MASAQTTYRAGSSSASDAIQIAIPRPSPSACFLASLASFGSVRHAHAYSATMSARSSA